MYHLSVQENKLKYLILGKGGQLGTEWCRSLEKTVTDYRAEDSSTLDITQPEQVQRVLDEYRPDIVVNCAAYTNVDGAETETELNERVNHHAPGILAEASQELGALFIHYSTDYIFSGEPEDKERYPGGYPEDAEPEPINAYGRAKLNGEQAIRKSGAQNLLIRVSWLCSSTGKNFLKTMLRLGRERKQLSVVNDQFGAPTFTFDVVDATRRLIDAEQSGIYHLSSEGICSWYDFAVRIFELAGMDTEVKPINSDAFPTKAKRPHFSKLSPERYKNLTDGITYNMDDGISRILTELKNQQGLTE